jgi:hypothetical protein
MNKYNQFSIIKINNEYSVGDYGITDAINKIKQEQAEEIRKWIRPYLDYGYRDWCLKEFDKKFMEVKK